MKIVRLDEAAFRRRLEQLYDILTSETATTIEKSDALRDAVSKIVYDKAHERVEIYYYI